MLETKKAPVLNEWFLVLRSRDGQINRFPPVESPCPSDQRLCVAGKVYGHGSIRNGTPTVTSPLIGVGDEDMVMTKSGSLYKLGDAAPDYKKLVEVGLKFLKENLPPILPRSQDTNLPPEPQF